MKHLSKTLLLLFAVLQTGSIFSQEFINKEWDVVNSVPGQYDYVSTALCPNGNLIVAGNNLSGSNCNIYTNCIMPNGNSGWAQTCSGASGQNHYGSDVTTCAAGNVYVCAAVHNGSNYDYRVNKYSPAGTLLWQRDYNGTGNNDDVPTAIVVDASGNIYVTGTSYGINTYTDFATLKIDGTNGTILWTKRYNFNNNPEVAVDIALNNLGEVLVCGASANNLMNSDFTVVKYNPANGTQTAVKRHNSQGSGYDLPSEMIVDANNNVYVIGTTNTNTSNKDIKIIAYNSSLNVSWVEYIDKSGSSDEGYGITVDGSGNILIAGYWTKANGGADFITAKYNSSGNQTWLNNRCAPIDTEIAKGRKVKTDSQGNIYVAGEMDINGSRDFLTVSYDPTGNVRWEKTFDNTGNGADNTAQLIVANDEVYVTGKSDNGTGEVITTVKYSAKEKPFVPVFVNGVAKYNDNEILIKFDRSALILPAIDKKEFTFGLLSEFVKNDVLVEMDAKFKFDWKNAPTYKIFLEMTTEDTVSISRTGVPVKMPDFWATLSVFVSPDVSEQQVIDSLNTMYPTIEYAELNGLGQFFAAPNDLYYLSQQNGLYNPLTGIRVEEAWDRQVGQPYVNIGVYDSGINWDHEDFGDGTPTGTKVVGGWDFYNNVSPFSSLNHDPDGHGTACAGLIGAIRNNNSGVAGIAGGDKSLGNTGVSLHSMKISADNIYIPISNVSSAIVQGATDYQPGFGYGLHIQNHSWGTDVYFTTLAYAVESCYQNECFFVASSGNYPQFPSQTEVIYPASFRDEWVYKVGATDATGNVAGFSIYGNNLDAVAPGTHDQYICVDNDLSNFYTDTFDGSIDIDGTSFAAPHATGVAGLLYSEHHPNNGYPNILAPEDFEAMMNSFISDINTPGYDLLSGHGRLNADYALEKCSLPIYYIKHSGGVNNPVTTMINTNVQISTPMYGLPAGLYVAERYQVTDNFVETLPVGHSLLSHWQRYSSSVGVSASNPISNDDTYFNYTINANQNIISGTTNTFCWHITSSFSGQPLDIWIPAHPSELRASYSLYIKDNNATSVDEIENENTLSVFPNPTTNQVTINFSNINLEDGVIEIYDAIGKIVFTQPVNSTGELMNTITVDLTQFSNGLYLCKLTLGENSVTKNLIKN